MPPSMLRALGLRAGGEQRARRALGDGESSEDENNLDPDAGLCGVCTGYEEVGRGGCTCGNEYGQSSEDTQSE